MRPYITTGPRSRDGSIPCQCTLTKEKFEAIVSDQDLHLMYDRNFLFRYPKACPFLSEGSDETFICIIYSIRPTHCRNFDCAKKSN